MVEMAFHVEARCTQASSGTAEVATGAIDRENYSFQRCSSPKVLRVSHFTLGSMIRS